MKVLVTGATGFIGGWLCKRLHSIGHEVHVLVRPTSDLSDLNETSVTLHYGDVCDLGSLKKSLSGMDAVFHLAGVIGYTSEMRPAMERVNVYGTRLVLQACKESGVKKMLYMSSVAAVGASRTPNVLNEDNIYNISDLDLGYFETKHRAELLVLDAQARGQIEAIIINPSTTYGARDATKGSRKTQLKVAQGRFPFYPSGGVNILAIEDLIDGIIAAWEKGTPGERYILAGENLYIRDLFRIIAEEADAPVPNIPLPNFVLFTVGWIGDLMLKFGKKGPISLENAYTSTMFHWFDSSKAQRELGFRPKPAREAIHNSVQWIKDNQLLK